MPDAPNTSSWRPWVFFALGWALLLGILFAPLFAGGAIINPMSDARDGYSVRAFAAAAVQQWGEVPRWNPYMFGGMPLLGAMYGDQVYPITLALRAMFTPALAIGLGMVLHAWLAAVGLLAFLRKQGLEWGAAMVGATAYGISGPLLSLFYPGHDGKIYVLGLTPWALLAIGEAVRTRKPVWFALWAALVGLMLLSPHFQMTYYSSLLMGAFLFFTLFTETERGTRLRTVAGFAAASVLALALAGAQLLPFVEYLPFSPRSVTGSSSTGWEYATSWAMPALELVGTLWGGFNGWHETYWGTNPFKLHSDYLGLLVGVLALTALVRTPAGQERRRVWFWVGAVAFGTLWVLGGQTPFYKIPYYLFPMISKTRAPSMMWGHVALAVGVLAGLGTQQWLAMAVADRERWAKRVLAVTAGAAVLLIASAQGLITSLADPSRIDAAYTAIRGAQLGLAHGVLTVLLFAAVAWKAPRWLAPVAMVLILADLGTQIRRFIVIDPRGDQAFAADAAVQAMQQDAKDVTQPWRALPLGRPYLNNYLVNHRIRNVLGYHGNELHDYDETLGGKNQWTHVGDPQMWRMLAVRYLLLPELPQQLPPGFEVIAANVETWDGERVSVVRLPDPAPWAQVAPAALKVADDAQIRATILNPRFDPSRLVLVSGEAAFGETTPPAALPEPVTPAPTITVKEEAPGDYRINIAGLVRDGVLVVSENYMPTWTATVDGVATPVAEANGTFIAVPVKAGAKEVFLSIASPADRRGRQVSYAASGLLLLVIGAGWALGRRQPPEAQG